MLELASNLTELSEVIERFIFWLVVSMGDATNALSTVLPFLNFTAIHCFTVMNDGEIIGIIKHPTCWFVN